MSTIQKRIFVGNVLNNQQECFDDLYKRFQTFGQIDPEVSGFDNHGTFGFLNLTFPDETEFLRLKKNFNKVNFKGNMLVIDIAKSNYQEQWKIQHENDIKESELIEKRNAKRDWEHYKKLENIQMSWIDHKEVIKGRIRKTPRAKKALSNITFRIDVNGSLKVYKCYKNKLWGYERNKELGDLVYKFVGNKWRNGFDHIVDRLSYARSKQSVHFRNPEDGSTMTITNGSSSVPTNEDDGSGEEEQLKNNNVLSNLLTGFDFDDVNNAVDSDEAEQFGFNEKEEEEENYQDDYYNNNNNYNDNYNDNYGNNNDYNNNYNDNYNGNYDNNNNYNNQKYYEEEEPYNRHNNKKEKYEKQEEYEEEEPIPVFTDKPVNNVVTGTVSNTETLRSLFNPEVETTQTGFSLMGSTANNDDIEINQNKQDTVTEDIVPEIEIAKPGATNHLFFAHFKSPFLLGQTQLTKLSAGTNKDILNNWDQEFWDNRGTWTREMRNKKRDAMRQLQKKKSRDSNHILI